MKKAITIYAIILMIITLNLCGCTNSNEFIGSWKLIERLGDPPLPGVNTTWTFYENNTYIGTTTTLSGTTSVWSTYEIKGDKLYTTTINGGVPLNYIYEFSNNNNLLTLYSLFQEDTTIATAKLQRISK